MDLFALSAKLRLDSKNYEHGLRDAEASGKVFSEKLQKTFDTVGRAFKAILSVAAVKKAFDTVLNFANAVSEAGDRIDKQSQVLGMSRKAYQEWDYILGQNGVSIDSMSVSMKTLNSAISSAADGNKEYVGTLVKLGLNYVELQKMSPEKQFEETVRAFQKMPAGAKKSALAVKMFGKSGMELLPLLNSSSTSIDDLRKKAQELGLIMSDDAIDASVAYGDAMDSLKRTFTSLKNKIGAAVLPALTRDIDKITSYAGKLSRAYDEKGFAGVWETLVADFKSIKWPSWNDVKNVAIAGWETIKKGVLDLGGLVFGTKENDDGSKSVNWPDFNTAVAWAKKNIWEDGIVAGVNKLGGLVFGTETNDDGSTSVNWPSWSTAVEWARTNIWENGIVKGVKEFGGLVFGKKKDDETGEEVVAWPNLEQIKTWAKEQIWDKIKLYVSDLGGLVFGKNEKGEVKWPEWKDVTDAAKTAWDNIVKEAKSLGNEFGKLVFGTDEKGDVKWPSWTDVINSAKTAWGKIKAAAKTLGTRFGKLVFGTNEKGDVNWPSVDDVRESAKVAWGKIREFAYNLGDEFGKLVFGTNEKGDVNWPSVDDVRESARKFWVGEDGTSGVVGAIADFMATTYNLLNPDSDEQVGKISDWWYNDVKPKLNNVLDYTLALFGLPSAKDMADAINKWFDDLMMDVSDSPLKLVDAIFGTNLAEEQKRVRDTRAAVLGDKNESGKTFAQQVQADAAARYKAQATMSELEKEYEEYLKNLKPMDVKMSFDEWTKKRTDDYIKTLNNGVTVPVTFAPVAPGSSFGNGGRDIRFMHNAKGAWDIPYDNYPALLHRGERVLTASQARHEKEGTVDTGAIAAAVSDAIRSAMSGLNLRAYVIDRDVTEAVNRRIGNDLKARRFAT